VTSSGEMGEGSEVRRLPFTSTRLRALRSVDRVLVLTPHMAREVRELGVSPDRIRVLPNSVEIPPVGGEGRRKTPREQRNGAPKGQKAAPEPPHAAHFRLLFVGRLSTEKRLEDLLKAAAILASEGWSLVVELVGGPDPDRNAEPALRKTARKLEEEGEAVAVHLRGHRSDVDSFYRTADAFILPSSTEGLSNALLEAMAHGIPCVVSDIPQNRFAVGEAGLLFSTGSPRELAEAVRRLLEDREEGGDLARRLSEAARERVEREFSLESVVDRLEGVYAEVSSVSSAEASG